jgi:hypothetical protein
MEFLNAHPSLMIIFTIMAVSRAVMKPLFSAAHAAAQAGHFDSFDALVSKVESSQALKVMAYILDWAASIKLTSPVKEVFQEPLPAKSQAEPPPQKPAA